MANHFIPIDKAADGSFNNAKLIRIAFDSLPVGLSMMELRTVNRHSRAADGYYRAVVCKYVLRGLQALGHSDIQDEDDAHHFMKQHLNKGNTTSTMNDAEFSAFVEKACRWAAEDLNEVIPPANKFHHE